MTNKSTGKKTANNMYTPKKMKKARKWKPSKQNIMSVGAGGKAQADPFVDW